MATSSIGAFLTAYLAAVRAAVPAGVAVYDGAGLTDLSADLTIFIGLDSLDSDGPAVQVANGLQEWATTGKTRDERYEIPGVVAQRNESDDLAAARAAALNAVANIETALLADPSVGAVVLYVLLHITGVSAFYDQAGVVSVVEFTVKVRARI